ncbi:MAG TPA: tRNA (guanosine(37)-N1)-methyltransferase TrmD [bacterium]|nr:tRNA (guanosine(37)-N1)-methyltransferase TrmD [bacterium]HPY99253.1 tRNA (guanosine(37)-N1)-methyltransferase TrmD [bacterium]HQB76429.1 tRNA (guanosine(37)-N1)-methyltransferase TrmD [bacterium]
MKFKILSIFPDILNSYLEDSIIKRAVAKKIIKIEKYDLRNWTNDRHRTVDDAPYGGGAGMLMKIEPLYQALKEIKKKSRVDVKKRKIILLSASGKTWNQKLAKQYSCLEEIIFICGRYEGVDARIKKFIDEEISIGDYVLTGGELPALVIIDSITRLLPGVLGNSASIEEESHNKKNVLEYPQYTRPAIFVAEGKKYAVPKVLLKGNHAQIKDWRHKKQKTKKINNHFADIKSGN